MATEQLIIIVRAQGTAQAAGGIRRIGTASRGASRAVGTLRTALLGLGVALGLREIRESIDSFTQVENRIRLATNTTEEATNAFNGLFQVARETRAPIEATTELFRRLALNTRDLGLEQNELLGVIKTVNQAVVISGATAKEARNGIIQLSQGFASGQLRGEEFRAVAEQLPRLLIAIADGTELTIGELREFAFQGGLSAEVVARALQSQAQVINEEFKKVTPTIEQVFTVIQNEITLAIGSLGKLTGSTSLFTGGLLKLSEGLGNTLVKGVATAIDAFADFVRAGATVLKTIEDIGIELADLGTTFSTIFGIFRTLITGFDTALNIFRTSANVTKNLWLSVGNAIGLVSDEAVSESLSSLQDATGDLTKSAFKTERQLKSLYATLSDPGALDGGDNAGAQLEDFANRLELSAEQLRIAAERGLTQPVDVPIPEAATSPLDPDAPKKAKEAEDAAAKLVSLEERLLIVRQRQIDPLNAQIERLRQQREEALRLGELAGVAIENNKAAVLAAEGITVIQEKRADLTQQVVDKEIEIEALLVRIRNLSPEFADEMERALIAVLETGGGLAKIDSGLEGILTKSESFLAKEDKASKTASDQIAKDLASSVSNIFQTTLRGEAVDFSKFLADQASKALEKSLEQVFEALAESVSGLLKQASGALGGEGGIGANLGAGLGALVGVGGLLLSAALQGSEAQISNELAQDRTAVTDVRPVRGVVAGPTSIPIFQVGIELENALIPTNEILADILAAVSGGGGGAAAGATTTEEDAGTQLNTTSATLI